MTTAPVIAPASAGNSSVSVVHPDLCGGCGMRLYVKVGQLHICDHCTQTFGFGSQIWMCTECGTPRKYGDGDPSDRNPKMLNCGKCQDVTEHQFFEVSRGLAGLARK